MQKLSEAFRALGDYAQFILYRIEGAIKYPVNLHTLIKCDINDAQNRVDFFTAQRALSNAPINHGIGFVFTENDPFFFVDIDKAYNTETRQWSQLACEIRTSFPYAAVETSTSGTGLHIIGSFSEPVVHRCRATVPGLELYTQRRFVALTGYHAQGDVGHDCTPALRELIAKYFVASETPTASVWTDTARPEWKGYDTDEALINAALSSKSIRSAFGNAASFRELWFRDVDALAKYFPDAKRAFNESDADMSLACHLAFYTGANCERMYRLMLRSSLIRDKWIRRPDYLRDTILRACAHQTSVMTMARTETSTQLVPADTPTTRAAVSIAPHEHTPIPIEGSACVHIQAQPEFFRGCVYVHRTHQVLTPDGLLLDPEQFKVQYGGRLFVLDHGGEKTTTDAWRAFTQSQAIKFPKVYRGVFLPRRCPGEIFEHDGRLVVNTWYPIKTPRLSGDPTPFLTHIAKLLPDRVDQTILISYLAACVQYPGVKFRWCPLIQGVEGNGKTLLAKCVAEAVGFQYTHSPRAQAIAARFNSWMQRKLFAWVDEVLIEETDHEAIETLKVILSEDRIELEPKGVDAFFEEVCVNFVLNTNYKHAIRKTQNERRFAIFFTAQQTYEDLEKSGLTSQYFVNFVDNFLKKDGYAIVHDFLATYEIPDEYNPATNCVRAPMTSTTHEAITATQAPYDIEIKDAITDELPGFRAGFISSSAMEKLLEKSFLHKMLPRRARRQYLDRLGYVPHPLLDASGGRTPRQVMPDACRTTLYVKKTSNLLRITDVGALLDAYSSSQA